MLIQPRCGQHGQHPLAVAGLDGLLTGDRIHSAIGQRGSHHGKIPCADAQRTLAGVNVGGEIGVAVHAAIAVQEVGDSPVAVVGRRLGLVHVIVHHQSPPGESRHRGNDALEFLVSGRARHQARGGHGTGIDQRVHRAVGVELDGHHRVEGQARAVDA